MSHAAIVLPGQSYTADMPGLAIPIDVLRSCGATVTVVDYDRELEPQVVAALEGATRITVIAKSKETGMFGQVQSLFPASTEAIWITPLFHDPEVAKPAIAARLRCLSVYATDDACHDPDWQAKVTVAGNGVELALDNVGHGMAMSDEQRDALREAVEKFVG